MKFFNSTLLKQGFVLAICLVHLCNAKTVDSSRTVRRDNKKARRWVFVPVIAREEETSWQFGAAGIHFFPKIDADNPAPKIQFSAVGSLNKQFECNLKPNIWFDKGRQHLTGQIEGKIWPSSVFQQGQASPDTSQPYSLNSMEIKGEYSYKILNYIFAGVNYRYQWYDIEPDGEYDIINTYEFGKNGGHVSGMGLSLKFDSRNHKVWPTRGSYATIKPQFNHSLLGSEYDYQALDIGFRQFFPFFGNSVIGMAAQIKTQGGNIPFFKLNRPDGSHLLRGLNASRYRDRNFMGGQIEVRSPFIHCKKWKWFGPVAFTAFGDMGQVARKLSGLERDQFIYAVGGGFRYCVAPEELVNIRADLAYVDDGISLTIEFEEAF